MSLGNWIQVFFPPMLGHNHSVLLDSSGAVWTLGLGSAGQLGHGNEVTLSSPQRVIELPPCVVARGGVDFTACVSTEGDVYCFGTNDYGQLGQGHTRNQNKPQKVKGMPPIRSLACGQRYVMCVGRDGSVWAFGHNEYGQLGLGHTQNVSTPQRVENIKARQVACAFGHSLILSEDGQVYGCGSSSAGELGSLQSNVNVPTPLGLTFQAHSVHGGYQLSVIRGKDGTVWTAGYDAEGQRGLGGTGKPNQFQKIPNLTTRQVACGNQHVMVIDDQSRLWGWGYCTFQQLGMGISDHSRPVMIKENIKSVLTGIHFNVIRTHDDQVWVCGYNNHGQLGNRTNSNTNWTSTTISPDMITLSGENSSLCMDWQEFGKSLTLSMDEVHRLSEIDLATQHIHQLLESSPDKVRVPAAPFSLGSWTDCSSLLNEIVNEYTMSLIDRKTKHTANQKAVNQSKLTLAQMEEQLNQERSKIERLEQQERTITRDLESSETQLEVLRTLLTKCETYAKAENQYHEELEQLLTQHPLRTLEPDQMGLVWWRAGLSDEQGSDLVQWGITGDIAANTNSSSWQEVGLGGVEACQVKFTLSMLDHPGGLSALRNLGDEDCVVCNSYSPWTTKNLLHERGIHLKEEFVKEWTTPCLIFANLTKNDFQQDGTETKNNAGYLRSMHSIQKLYTAHQSHLSYLCTDSIK